VIRIFNVHYPLRALILVIGEGVMVCASFLLGTMLRYREDSYLVLNFEYGYYKILAVTVFVLLLSHWFDLYDPTHFDEKGELYFRLLLVPGLVAVGLGLVATVFPKSTLGNSSSLLGLIILTVALLAWRSAYSWLAQQPYLRDRVYVLGAGERAQRLVCGLQTRPELGVDVVGWSGDMEGAVTRQSLASHLQAVAPVSYTHLDVYKRQQRTFPRGEGFSIAAGDPPQKPGQAGPLTARRASPHPRNASAWRATRIHRAKSYASTATKSRKGHATRTEDGGKMLWPASPSSRGRAF